jgi:hypothetical protein
MNAPADLTKHSLEALRRKANQHWEMAGLARADHDRRDEKRHTELAREFDAEIQKREAQ